MVFDQFEGLEVVLFAYFFSKFDQRQKKEELQFQMFL